MRAKPYHVIDKFTGETLDWCTYEEYIIKYAGNNEVDVNYRPGRKAKVKK